jgi:hypothetical protein
MCVSQELCNISKQRLHAFWQDNNRRKTLSIIDVEVNNALWLQIVG